MMKGSPIMVAMVGTRASAAKTSKIGQLARSVAANEVCA
jgi:hypothetical protein